MATSSDLTKPQGARPTNGARPANGARPSHGAHYANGYHATNGSHPSIGNLVQEASTHFSTVLRGEIELAKVELQSSLKNAKVGAGSFAVAAVLLVFSLTFGLIALAEGLVAAHLWRWAAYLIVFGFLVLTAAVLALLGLRKVKRVKAPQRTISTGKETVAYLTQRPGHLRPEDGSNDAAATSHHW